MTPTQRRIFWYLKEHGEELATNYCPEGGRYNFVVARAEAGGLIFQVYSDPLYFMCGRGWFERVDRNVNGRWYRLTEAGRAQMNAVKKLPPSRQYRHQPRRRSISCGG